MNFHRNDFVKVLSPTGKFRYGYVLNTRDGGWSLTISLDDEGASKIAFDSLEARHKGMEPENWADHLTDTERRIIPLLASDMDTKGIALQMMISPVTARIHIRNLRLKLHLDDRAQLCCYCQGLVNQLEATAVSA